MADDIPAARGAAPFPATVVIAAAALIGASAHQSATLGYFATLVVSLVPVLRAACPELVDADLGRLDACLRRSARLARADLASDVRRLRDMARDLHPVVAIVCDRAEERARVARAAFVDGVGALRRWAEATWSEHEDAINSACFFLHLVDAVVNAAATALVSAAYEAASARAPAALSHLRGVIDEVRSEEAVAASSPGFFKYRDMAPLVQTAAFLALITDIFVHTNAMAGSPLPVWVPCFMAACFTAAIVAVTERGCLTGDSDDTAATADTLDTASNTSPRAGHRGGPARAAELEVPKSWRFLWFVMIMAYCVDACLLRFTLGPRPLAVSFLALCHVNVIDVGRKVRRAPDDQSVNGGASRWRRTATAVLAASSVKVLAIAAVLNVQLAGLSLVALCITGVLLVMREENLSDLDASGGNNGGEEGAGFTRNVIEGAEEEAGEFKAEQSNTRREEHAEEQPHEEPDHSSSSSMDGWDFVEVDPSEVDQN